LRKTIARDVLEGSSITVFHDRAFGSFVDRFTETFDIGCADRSSGIWRQEGRDSEQPAESWAIERAAVWGLKKLRVPLRKSDRDLGRPG
jgi:hypothetical protein